MNDTKASQTDHGPCETQRGHVGLGPILRSPTLGLAAEVVDDLERVRIANENRLRQLTRTEEDSDGIVRGFELDIRHPDIMRLQHLIDSLSDSYDEAVKNLEKTMRAHSLGSWIKKTVGVGEKQGARLLAAIGDPYWNDLHNRPRTVSELWAYCGYHVLSAGQAPNETHEVLVSGATLPVNQKSYDPHGSVVDGTNLPAGQVLLDTHGTYASGSSLYAGNQGTVDSQNSPAPGVAAKRQKGVRVNWSATAKMRAFLIAESCVKAKTSPYRKVYDDTRVKYAEATHQVPCVRCGPRGKPALVGSPLSLGHQHARALRAISKTVLKDLWIESKRLHELQQARTSDDTETIVSASSSAA